MNSKSREEDNDQESIRSSTTPDTGYRMGKRQINKKTSHTGEPRNQPLPSRWPQGCMTQIRKFSEDKHKIKNIHKRSTGPWNGQ